jgi:hypothetical protein
MKDNSKKSSIILYETDEGLKLQVKMEDETVWLTLNQIAELFGRDKSTISKHIKNIFETAELSPEAVVAKNATTASDGKTYMVDYFNLDMIISAGYRVNSIRGTKFRIWATKRLKEYVISERADSSKPNMGITSIACRKVQKKDVFVAKNYLNHDELQELNLIVDQYLSFAELQARNNKTMKMEDWIRKLDDFLRLNEKEILDHHGRISKKMADEKAESEYKKFKKNEDKKFISDFDKSIKKFLEE